MSADNWAICPRCFEKLKQEFKNSYGKVSEEEYNELKQKLKDFEDDSNGTLREDFNIGVKDNGVFAIDYICKCIECGFEYEYSFSERAEE